MRHAVMVVVVGVIIEMLQFYGVSLVTSHYTLLYECTTRELERFQGRVQYKCTRIKG